MMVATLMATPEQQSNPYKNVDLQKKKKENNEKVMPKILILINDF